jgi:hypothetical protein
MSEQFGSSTFPFVLGITTSNNFTRNVSQTFLDDAIGLETIFRDAADRIFFFGAYPGPNGGPTGEIGQTADTNFVYLDVDQTFFTVNVAGLNQEENIVQFLGYTDRYITEGITQRIFDRFELTPQKSRAGVVTTVNLSNEFDWNDHNGDLAFEALQRVYTADQPIGFSQTLLDTPEVGDLFDTIFSTGQVADVDNSTDFGGTESQTFLQQAVSFHIQGGSPEKEYTPFIGEGDDSYDPVPTTPPVLGSGTLTLTHPRVTPTLTLTLKNPEFGNADVVRFTKVDRLTRGGDRKFFSDSGWGSTQSFELEIANVCEAKVSIDDILDFLNASLGEEIGLLDWENRQWKGIIVAPETDVTPQVGGHTVRIVFEGELV